MIVRLSHKTNRNIADIFFCQLFLLCYAGCTYVVVNCIFNVHRVIKNPMIVCWNLYSSQSLILKKMVAKLYRKLDCDMVLKFHFRIVDTYLLLIWIKCKEKRLQYQTVNSPTSISIHIVQSSPNFPYQSPISPNFIYILFI